MNRKLILNNYFFNEIHTVLVKYVLMQINICYLHEYVQNYPLFYKKDLGKICNTSQ